MSHKKTKQNKKNNFSLVKSEILLNMKYILFPLCSISHQMPEPWKYCDFSIYILKSTQFEYIINVGNWKFALFPLSLVEKYNLNCFSLAHEFSTEVDYLQMEKCRER